MFFFLLRNHIFRWVLSYINICFDVSSCTRLQNLATFMIWGTCVKILRYLIWHTITYNISFPTLNPKTSAKSDVSETSSVSRFSTLKKQEPFRWYDKSFIFLLSFILLCFPPNIIKILQFRHSTELAVPMQVDNKKKYLWIWSNKQENWTAW